MKHLPVLELRSWAIRPRSRSTTALASALRKVLTRGLWLHQGLKPRNLLDSGGAEAVKYELTTNANFSNTVVTQAQLLRPQLHAAPDAFVEMSSEPAS
jgi:hypothetical protein